jgi:hypothetical protein
LCIVIEADFYIVLPPLLFGFGKLKKEGTFQGLRKVPSFFLLPGQMSLFIYTGGRIFFFYRF